MLALIRRFAKSPAASGLLALLVISFAVFGISDVFKNAGRGDAVVQAGNRTVTGAQFRAMFDRYLQGLAQQNGGQAPSIQEAAAQGADQQVLNEVTVEEAANAAIARAGVHPADELVLRELAKAPRFRNPITGAFDKAAYQTFLREQRISPQEVEGSLRDGIAQRQFLTGLVAGLQAPLAYTAVQAAFDSEARDFSYVTISAASVPAPAKPTDAELNAFLKQNAAALTRPETRVVSLVRFSAALLAPTLPVDEAELKKRFDFEKDSLSSPEKRTVVQIPLKSPAQAADVTARLKRGEAPAAVAASVGTQPVVATDAPRTAIADPAVAAAAFAMAKGEVRTVQGGLGASVVQVTTMTPGHDATLEEARPKLEAEVRKAAAAAKADELAGKYDDARAGGANFAEAAAKAGVTATQLPPFSAQGVAANGQPLPVPKKLVAAAFQLPKGGESELLQAGPGESYAIRVDEVRPPAPIGLEEIRAPLTARLMQQKLAQALQAKADAVAAQARTKGSLDGLAGPVQHAAGVTRTIARQQNAPYPVALMGRVFSAKPGEVATAPIQGTAPGQPPSVDVVRLERITPGSPQAVALASRQGGQAATVGLFEDLSAHLRDAARAQIKPRVDAARARSSLGLDPAATPGKPAAPAR